MPTDSQIPGAHVDPSCTSRHIDGWRERHQPPRADTFQISVTILDGDGTSIVNRTSDVE